MAKKYRDLEIGIQRPQPRPAHFSVFRALCYEIRNRAYFISVCFPCYLEVPVDKEDLEIRILLIFSSRYLDIRIHSDDQVYDNKVVVCRSSKLHDILLMLI